MQRGGNPRQASLNFRLPFLFVSRLEKDIRIFSQENDRLCAANYSLPFSNILFGAVERIYLGWKFEFVFKTMIIK